jgi:hypothetical protein
MKPQEVTNWTTAMASKIRATSELPRELGLIQLDLRPTSPANETSRWLGPSPYLLRIFFFSKRRPFHHESPVKSGDPS